MADLLLLCNVNAVMQYKLKTELLRKYMSYLFKLTVQYMDNLDRLIQIGVHERLLSSMNLPNPLLKPCKLMTTIIHCGSKFHTLIMHCKNKYFSLAVNQWLWKCIVYSFFLRQGKKENSDPAGKKSVLYLYHRHVTFKCLSRDEIYPLP